jgi:hypothetical protein
LAVSSNQLTGTVLALPFKQYTANCCLSPNNFGCPLPVDAAACRLHLRRQAWSGVQLIAKDLGGGGGAEGAQDRRNQEQRGHGPPTPLQ